MLKIGIVQNLEIDRMSEFGLYLVEAGSDREESVLLPNKEVRESMEIGDELRVFLYHDFMDRITATLIRPTIKLGEIRKLEVIDVNKTGTFLNWGLVKDLLLPFNEQKYNVEVGEEILVTLLEDDSKRLYATMRIYDNLVGTSEYSIGDQVTGTVYQTTSDLGVLVAIDDKYHGLILKHDLFQELEVGQVIDARVASINEDGKINISLKKKIEDQMDDDAKIILEALEFDGHLMYNDKSDPEDIKNEFNMSKRAFKRAVGRLLKMNKIELTDEGMNLIDGE